MENLFFFWGQEDFLINSEIEKLKKKYIDKNFEAMAYKKFYEPSFEDVISAIQTLPMMFGNIMYVIDVNKFFLSKNEEEDNSIEDWALSRYEEALKNKSDKNIVVLRLIIPQDSKRKVDTRKKIYKITSKYATEKQFPLYRDFDKSLPSVIASLGKNNGLEIDNRVSQKIIKQLGTNLGIINSELQKLAITIYPEKSPKIEDIENICTQKDDVFSILKAVFKNDTDSALSELKKNLGKSSLPEVMGAIQRSLRNFTIIKANYPKIGKSGVSQKLHLHEFIVEQNYEAMSNFSGKSLLKLRHDLIKTEYAIKSGECANPEIALEMALMGVCDV